MNIVFLPRYIPNSIKEFKEPYKDPLFPFVFHIELQQDDLHKVMDQYISVNSYYTLKEKYFDDVLPLCIFWELFDTNLAVD